MLHSHLFYLYYVNELDGYSNTYYVTLMTRLSSLLQTVGLYNDITLFEAKRLKYIIFVRTKHGMADKLNFSLINKPILPLIPSTRFNEHIFLNLEKLE